MKLMNRLSAALAAFSNPAALRIAGHATTPDEQLRLLYLTMQPDMDLRQSILDIRDMDKRDPRVKKIHTRTSRAACKGGLRLLSKPGTTRLQGLWADYERRLELGRREKLESDMRGAMMEGNLPLQWVLDAESRNVVRGVRMPTETLKPLVNLAGQFENPTTAAYEQWDWMAGKAVAKFPIWQLMLVRICPDNYDNFGSMGRPYLDSTRTVWRQLTMTEQDLVVRRHTRAPQRLSHTLEGATETDLKKYENDTRARQGSVTTDFFSNRKGGVTALQGDSNLDQIADVEYLLDTFFSGSPAPKGLFGYVGDLSRDILEDLKQDYFDEIDALQDNVSYVYELGFRLDLLLKNINPDADEFSVQYAERRTDTPNQRADLALKHQALGVPADLCWETAGLDPNKVREHIENQDDDNNPYPNHRHATKGAPKVTVTPGNRPKHESGTTIST